MQKYDLLLEQFIFLGALLQSMDVELDIDEHGLTIEDFQKIDFVLEDYLKRINKGKMKREVVELVRTISQTVDEDFPNLLDQLDNEEEIKNAIEGDE